MNGSSTRDRSRLRDLQQRMLGVATIQEWDWGCYIASRDHQISGWMGRDTRGASMKYY